jgi:hypothetical protein
VRAQVGGQTVDVAAEFQHGIFRRPTRKRAHRRSDGLRLRPTTLPRPGFEPIKILVIEVYLERPAHDSKAYLIMIPESMPS